ncbi:MAG: hypothetical protein RR583_04025, partial [Enterococcus sp.]
LLVGVSMKKPIRDNWYIHIIIDRYDEFMNSRLLIAKKCIRKNLCKFLWNFSIFLHNVTVAFRFKEIAGYGTLDLEDLNRRVHLWQISVKSY